MLRERRRSATIGEGERGGLGERERRFIDIKK
jgi:hypothetical protein